MTSDASLACSGIELDGLDLGVELSRRRTLLAAAGARSLHSAEGRVRVDAGGVAVDAHHPDLDLLDVAERAPYVAREQRRAETIHRIVGQRDGMIEVLGREARPHGSEQLFPREIGVARGV